MCARFGFRLGLVIAILALAGVCTAAAQACGVARPLNQPVAIASESAIIIWDAANETQHFIRRASFTSEAENFGFLVPTPSEPSLHEASDDAFKELGEITKPRVVKHPRPPSGGRGCSCGGAGAPQDAAAGKVQVLQEGVLGRYDYKVLKIVGGKVETLKDWLLERKYEFTKELETWVTPYVDADYIITAFKINKEAADKRGVSTKAIRMTFKTKQPFFPYHEPEEKSPDQHRQVGNPRLRVFFLSNARVKGTLGKMKEAWSGQTVWANNLSDEQRSKVLGLLKMPKETPPAPWWLTEFEDYSSPRLGKEDLFFSASEDQSTVERPAHIQYTGISRPDCVMSCALAAFFVVSPMVRWWRRRYFKPLAV